MDVTIEMRKIIDATVAFTQQSQDQNKIAELLSLSTSFLYVLDNNKEVPYRIAIIDEYLENIAELIPNIDVAPVMDYLNEPDNKKLQKQICDDICRVITQYFDPRQINPNLVTFWLGRSCNLQEIKIMSALMLFLEPVQQQSILAFDKNFLSDPKLQLLKNCLPK